MFASRQLLLQYGVIFGSLAILIFNVMADVRRIITEKIPGMKWSVQSSDMNITEKGGELQFPPPVKTVRVVVVDV